MSRPKPKVIVSWTNSKTYKSEEILAATGIYAVFYDGLPINLRTLNNLIPYPNSKYHRVSFSHPGHAFNLAEKLNKLFNTTKFQVYLLDSGKPIEEAPKA